MVVVVVVLGVMAQAGARIRGFDLSRYYRRHFGFEKSDWSWTFAWSMEAGWPSGMAA